MSNWLPSGLFGYGSQLGAEINARLDDELIGDTEALIDMPRRLGTSDVPNEPERWGDGALCVDLGPDDGEAWLRFAEVARDLANPEAVAAAAQEWRLPVTPYRRLRDIGAMDAPQPGLMGVEPNPGFRRIEGADQHAEVDRIARIEPERVARARIVDMTSMWAGPLCTELLARAGAEVHKIESTARPDGLAGTQMYDELNAHKQVHDLDLRSTAGHACFDTLLASADLLVTSLSHRALGNFGLLPSQVSQRHRGLRTLAITAFAQLSPECDWIAYGTGVHATSGLGWLGPDPQAPAYSYPDPLAGLGACAVALDQINDRLPTHRRVSLAEAVEPLVAQEACARAEGVRTDSKRHD